MSISCFKNAGNLKKIISLIGCMIVGLTFIVSGTVKIFGLESTPAQVSDFISYFMPDFLITPATMFFLSNIFIPYIVPWAELILGLLLLIGFMPRLIAILCVPLIIAFMGTNIWTIVQGKYATCASCFGMWEKIFGSFTPVQSLIYDIVLLIFAIAIITLYPGRLLSSYKWIDRLLGKNSSGTEKQTDSAVPHVKGITGKLQHAMRLLKVILKRRSRVIKLGIGIIGIVLVAFGVLRIIFGIGTLSNTSNIPNINTATIAVAEVSSSSAQVSWTTDKPIVSKVIVYGEKAEIIKAWIYTIPTTDHKVLLDGLASNTTYYFDIVLGDDLAIPQLSKVHFFTTLIADVSAPVITDVRISGIIDSSAIIIWTTNEPASSRVEYWTTGSSNRLDVSEAALVTNHKTNLKQLIPGNTYTFRIQSIDASGNQATSAERTFTLAVGAKAGKIAPDFTLTSIDGKKVKLSDYQGKLVLLDFWMNSCAACRSKIAILQKAFTALPTDKIAILTIHVEGKESVIKSFAINEKLTLPILLDLDGKVSDLYQVATVPTVFFIDADGIIRQKDTEFVDVAELENIFNSLKN